MGKVFVKKINPLWLRDPLVVRAENQLHLVRYHNQTLLEGMEAGTQ